MPSPAGYRFRGVTLVELTLAMVVTAFIALAVAIILQSAAYGTSTRRDYRRIAVRGEVMRGRINDAVRSARAVLASGSAYLVLWTGDTRQNDQVNLSELQLIELSGGTLSAYEVSWPAGWSQTQIDNADTAYAANTDFYAAAQAAKLTAYFPPTAWGTGVSDMTVTLNGAAPQLSTMASWTLTLTNGALSEPLTGAASLRQSGTPQ